MMNSMTMTTGMRRKVSKYYNDEKIYRVSDISSLCEDFDFKKKRDDGEYMNAPIAFDIETSSFYDKGEKRAIMYAFVFCIKGHTIIGRTWEEFFNCLDFMVKRYNLSKDRKMIVYVHNLSFEFSFIQNRFEWAKIFSNDERKPLYALTTTGIEFRCSYFLSGYALKTVGEHLSRYPIEKMSGDLDYSLIRTPETHLTDKEIKYIQHDGLVVTSFIQEEIEKNQNNITKLPFTKTGYVRNYCRKMCFYGGENNHKKKGVYNTYKKYRNFISHMIIEGSEEYLQLKRAFHGGFTHASPMYSGFTKKDVTSFDFTSSYPAVMVMEKFPMASGRLIKINDKSDFDFYCKYYCCVFDVEFSDIESTTMSDNPISSSKCFYHEDWELDNGRVASAKKIRLTMTDVDFSYMHLFYKWREMKVKNFRIYKRGYLPKNFIMAILTLYQKKTELKGVVGQEEEYQKSKENLNGCYGMSVTDICRPEYIFDDEGWSTEYKDIDDMIDKYNSSTKRFLCYQWGVFVTAYAQRNLFTGIHECRQLTEDGEEIGCDYIYSDTDSIKILNAEKHMDYINNYNKEVRRKLKRMCENRGIDFALCHPFTIKGKEKLIGVWDFDGKYKTFKTLGAKRYMVEYEDGHHSLTVSGLNKVVAMPYIEEIAKEKNITPFDVFDTDMYIPSNKTGKNTHTYIDFATEGVVTDYLGNKYHYQELSGCHIEGCDYTLSLAYEYIDFLKGVRKDFVS